MLEFIEGVRLDKKFKGIDGDISRLSFMIYGNTLKSDSFLRLSVGLNFN